MMAAAVFLDLDVKRIHHSAGFLWQALKDLRAMHGRACRDDPVMGSIAV